MRKNIFPTLYITILLLFLIRLLPLVIPDARLWGLNQLNFLPDIYTVIYIALALVALLVPIPAKATDWGNSAADKFTRTFYESPRKYIYRFGLIVPVAVVFAVLAAPTHFLGDGYTLISNLASDKGTFYKWSEKGITLILSGIQTILGGRSESTALAAFRIVSVFSGMVSIWFFFGIAGILSENKLKRLLAFSAMFISASLLLFFGYVENYPLLWAAFTGFIYFGLRCLKKENGLIYPLLFLLAGLFLHLQAVLLIPVFVFLILCRDPGRKIYKKYKLYFWLLTATAAIAFIIIFIGKYRSDLYFENIFLPLFTGKPASPEYALISLPHIADILNQLLLLSPLLIMLIIAGAKNIKAIFRENIPAFLALTSMAGLLFIFAIDPKLGMPRDWDLFSLSALAPTLLFIYLIRDKNTDSLKRLYYGVFIYLIAASVPYLMVNLHTGRSLDYVKYLADLDTGKSMSTLVTIREYYGAQGEQARGDSVNNIIPVRFPDVPKMQKAFSAIRRRDFNTARSVGATITPDKFSANYHNFMYTLYIATGDYQRALAESDKLIQLQKYNFKYYLNRSYILMGMRRADDAMDALRLAYKYNRESDQVLEMLSSVHYNMSRFDSAAVYADILIGDDSANVAGYYLKCKAMKMLGDNAEARKYLDIYMQRGRTDPLFESRMKELVELLRGEN